MSRWIQGTPDRGADKVRYACAVVFTAPHAPVCKLHYYIFYNGIAKKK
jgi:hypothetical protein